MTANREGATATLLSDGRVLITGGDDITNSFAPFASAELYDPKTGTFSATGSMSTARVNHTATLLSDGRVLIAGGRVKFDAPAQLASAELYDPKTGTFSPTGSMVAGRSGSTATLLSDSRVLIAGGGGLSSAELYDPSTGKFSSTGPMSTVRELDTATRLSDGRVLIAGGESQRQEGLASAELYDPSTGKFGPTASMTAGREQCTATLLADGRVLMAGGLDSKRKVLASTQLYDPATGKFSPSGSMAGGRFGNTATALSDGRVLIAGGLKDTTTGVAVATAELYDPNSGTFSSIGPMAEARVGQTSTLLSDGRVLIAGGRTTSAELYQP
jgi:hypothetical protein